MTTTTTASPLDQTVEGETAVPHQDVTDLSVERSRLQISLIMVALCLAVFLHALDNTIVATALPTVSENFHSQAVYTWVGSAYLFGVAATSMIWAKLSNIFGRKPIILSANITFFAGSLLSALSVSGGMLITARAVQGIGGAGLNVLTNICIADLFSLRERGIYYGIVSGVWAVALSLGPVVGGLLTQTLSWRWCFYINLPFCGIAFIIIFVFLDLKTPGTPFLDGIKAIDWVGASLSTGSTLMILLGLTFGGQTMPWRSATVISLILFGIVGWVVCFLWEFNLAKYPILPMSVFRPSIMAVLGTCFIQTYAFVASAYYLPLYFQAVLDANPVFSGVYLLPTAISISLSSTGTGVYMHKTGQYLVPIYAGFVLQTIGYGLFIDLSATTNWPKIIMFQLVAGVGVGFNWYAPMIALQSMTATHDMAAATSAFAFVRNVSGAISVVIGQVVLQNEMTQRQDVLATTLGPQLASELSGTGTYVDLIHGLSPDKRDAVHIVFVNSMKSMWIMYMAFSAAGLFICPFLSRNALSEEHQETMTGLDAEKKSRDDRLMERQERRDRKTTQKTERSGLGS